MLFGHCSLGHVAHCVLDLLFLLDSLVTSGIPSRKTIPSYCNPIIKKNLTMVPVDSKAITKKNAFLPGKAGKQTAYTIQRLHHREGLSTTHSVQDCK